MHDGRKHQGERNATVTEICCNITFLFVVIEWYLRELDSHWKKCATDYSMVPKESTALTFQYGTTNFQNTVANP